MTIPPGMPSWALAQMAASLDPPVDTSIGQHVRIMADKSWCVFPHYLDMSFPGATTQSYDDGAVINWALANIGRGSVVLSPGVFTVASAAGLTVPTGVRFRGQGFASQVLWDQTVTATLVVGSGPSQHASIEDLRLSQTNATPGGTCVDMSQFQFSTLERVTIDGAAGGGRPNIGVLHNAATCHYNVNRDCVIFVDGANAVGISYTGPGGGNNANSNVSANARIIISGSDATQVGVYVNAYAIELDHPDIENFAGTGIKIDTGATSNRPTTILHHYLEPGAGAGNPIVVVPGAAPPALAAQAFTISKPGNTPKTSTTGLGTDPDLQCSVLLGPRTYRFKFMLIFDGDAAGAADFGAALVAPAGSTVAWAADGLAVGATGITGSANFAAATAPGTQRNFATVGIGTPVVAIIEGVLITATTSGQFGLQWAQRVSDANPVTLYKGSFMRIEQIA